MFLIKAAGKNTDRRDNADNDAGNDARLISIIEIGSRLSLEITPEIAKLGNSTLPRFCIIKSLTETPRFRYQIVTVSMHLILNILVADWNGIRAPLYNPYQ